MCLYLFLRRVYIFNFFYMIFDVIAWKNITLVIFFFYKYFSKWQKVGKYSMISIVYIFTYFSNFFFQQFYCTYYKFFILFLNNPKGKYRVMINLAIEMAKNIVTPHGLEFILNLRPLRSVKRNNIFNQFFFYFFLLILKRKVNFYCHLPFSEENFSPTRFVMKSLIYLHEDTLTIQSKSG